MKSYRDRLDECYAAALKHDDVNLAVEVAERMKGLSAPVEAVDSQMVEFMGELDKMVALVELDVEVGYYGFKYGGLNFKVECLR